MTGAVHTRFSPFGLVPGKSAGKREFLQREEKKTGKNPIPVYITPVREESDRMGNEKQAQEPKNSINRMFIVLSILLALCLAAGGTAG